MSEGQERGTAFAYHLARQRITELEKALAPFAAEALQWSARVSDRYRPGLTEPRQKHANAKAEFSVGDCRRAWRLLQKPKGAK